MEVLKTVTTNPPSLMLSSVENIVLTVGSKVSYWPRFSFTCLVKGKALSIPSVVVVVFFLSLILN